MSWPHRLHYTLAGWWLDSSQAARLVQLCQAAGMFRIFRMWMWKSSPLGLNANLDLGQHTFLAVFFVMTVPPGEVIDQKYPRGYCVLSPHVHGLHSMFRVPFPSIDRQPSQSSLLRSAALRPTGRRFQCHVLRSRSRSSLPLGVLEGSPGKLLMVKHHSSSHP